MKHETTLEILRDFGTLHHMPTETNPVYIKQMHLPAGYCVDTHMHTYDHFGILGKGKAIVEMDGVFTSHSAPAVIEIKADKVHKITAIEDITWFCIHHSTETDESNIDSTLIKGE